MYEDYIYDLYGSDKKGKKVIEDVDLHVLDDELKMPNSHDEELKFKFKNFALVDIADPKFQVGHVFSYVELLTKAIK